MNKKLYRSRTDKIIGGVCGGLGKYFEIDPVLIRVLFVFLAFFHGSGLILYLLLLIIVPQEPLLMNEEMYTTNTEENFQSQNVPIETTVKKSNTKKIFGIILLILGTLLLLDNLLPLFDFELVFPLILIAAGLYLVFESLKSQRGE